MSNMHQFLEKNFSFGCFFQRHLRYFLIIVKQYICYVLSNSTCDILFIILFLSVCFKYIPYGHIYQINRYNFYANLDASVNVISGHEPSSEMLPSQTQKLECAKTAINTIRLVFYTSSGKFENHLFSFIINYDINLLHTSLDQKKTASPEKNKDLNIQYTKLAYTQVRGICTRK